MPKITLEGVIILDQDPSLSRILHGTLSIETSKDDKLWMWLNGVSLLRLRPYLPEEKKELTKNGT